LFLVVFEFKMWNDKTKGAEMLNISE
jgi:hypothetical protein